MSGVGGSSARFSDCGIACGSSDLDRLRGLRGPALIMPNHPGYIDPPLVLSHLRLRQPVRPVVRTTMYRLPFLYPVMRVINALEVPDLSEQSLSARERTLGMIDAVVAGLERGECFLIYPAGRTQRAGVEVIGGARAAAEILERCPQASRVLVRTRGLWGSMFTRARTGKAPDFGKRLLQGLGWLLANLFVFTPRRDDGDDRRVARGRSRTSAAPRDSESVLGGVVQP